MNHIVIGVDGSPAATAAARWAACEAAMRNVELTVVHVLQSAPEVWLQTGWPAIPLAAEVGEDQLAQGETILEDTLSVIAKTTGVRQPRSIASRVCIGAVVPTLSACSRKESQMTVVGRRGEGGCIVLCSAQSAAACCTMRTARSRWSTTTCHRFHRAQHRLLWVLTARQPPSQPSRSPSMKPRDAAWTWSPCTASSTPIQRWGEHCWEKVGRLAGAVPGCRRAPCHHARSSRGRTAGPVTARAVGGGRQKGPWPPGREAARLGQRRRRTGLPYPRHRRRTSPPSQAICDSPRRARNVPHDEQCRFLACCRRR